MGWMRRLSAWLFRRGARREQQGRAVVNAQLVDALADTYKVPVMQPRGEDSFSDHLCPLAEGTVDEDPNDLMVTTPLAKMTGPVTNDTVKDFGDTLPQCALDEPLQGPPPMMLDDELSVDVDDAMHYLDVGDVTTLDVNRQISAGSVDIDWKKK